MMISDYGHKTEAVRNPLLWLAKRLMSAMAGWRVVWAVCIMAWSLPAARGEDTNSWVGKPLTPFELKDQYGRLHTIAFPRTNLTVVTVADRAGAARVNSWIDPLKERYGNQIAMAGVASLGKVPRPFRGLAQARFRKTWAYPVMLDWNGEISDRLGSEPEEVTLLAVDRDGTILWRHAGGATQEALRSLFNVVDREL